MKNKIFRKTILVDHVKWGFDPDMVLHFYFHYKPFPGQTCKERDKERERRESYRSTRSHPSIGTAIYLAPPPRSHHHRRPIHPDWSHPTEDRSTRTNHTQIDPSKITSPQIDCTPLRSHHFRPIHPKLISSASSLPMTDLVALLLLPITDLVALSSLPITQTDLSLSLHFWSLSLPPSLSFDRMVEFNKWCCFDFCFFKFIDWNFLL